MKRAFLVTFLAAGIMVTVASVAIAQGQEGGMGSGMMQGGMGSGMMGRIEGPNQSGTRSGAMHGGMCSRMTMGSGMMCPCMMQGGMGSGMMGSGMMHGGMGSGMMGSGIMQGGTGSGMTGSGMMHGGMGSEMMGSGMMQGGIGSGMGTLFGSRVVPTMNLSVDDVRGYLNSRLDRLQNKRLKVGEVKADDATITADVVTVDNSLVQRLKVDRRTGEIDYKD